MDLLSHLSSVEISLEAEVATSLTWAMSCIDSLGYEKDSSESDCAEA